MTKQKLGPIFPGMVFESNGSVSEVTQVIRCDTDWDHFKYSLSPCSGWVSTDDLTPIPLTPDILKDWFGATWSKGLQDWVIVRQHRETKLNRRVRVFVQEYGLSIIFFRTVSISVLKHVHELQRLLAGFGLDHEAKIWGIKNI